jgi:uncharacterized SAM-binding protein YcdF (DUF218 family)
VAAELTKYAIWLLSPLGLWLVFCLLAWSGLLGQDRFRFHVLCVAHFQLFFFSLPWVGDALLGSLEKEARLMQSEHPLPRKLDAIVVLGGGVEGQYDDYRDLPDLNDASDRLWVAARLYKQHVAPVVLSGGSFQFDPKFGSDALGMRLFMQDMGVPKKAFLIEDRSRTTFENALRTREKLGTQAKRIALVTSAFHMGRSVLWFEQLGFTVYPVLADVRVIPNERSVWEWLPRPQALEESTLAIKEYLGRFQLNFSGVYAQEDFFCMNNCLD